MRQLKSRFRLRTACPHGHAYSPENTGVGSHGQRICLTCQRERMRRKRENPDFLKRGAEAMARYRARNPEHNRRLDRERRKSKYEWVNEFKASLRCARCGENHPACLEFHHRDRKEKAATISLVIWRWSRKKLMAEIEKCDVLCSNCHRKLHAAEREEQRRGKTEEVAALTTG